MAERVNLRGPFKADPVKPPSKPSQSLLWHLDNCAYAGHLYLKYGGGGPDSHAMARGNIFHEFAERATRMAQESAGAVDPEAYERAKELAETEAELREWLHDQGWSDPRLPADAARDLMQQIILEHPELNVPAHEQDSLRAMAWNFASGHVIDVRNLICVETMIELEVDGWTIRGKLDRAEVADRVGYVHDYKTSRSIPSEEEYAKKFQPPFYALLLVEGVYAEPDERSEQHGIDPSLYGTRVNTTGISVVNTLEHYPRFTYDATGELVSRFATFTAPQLADFKETIRASLRRLERGLETNEWMATPSSHCGVCPMEADCPIKPEYRGKPPEVATESEAVALAEDTLILERRTRANKSRLRGYVEANGDLVVGDYVFGLQARESRRVLDHDKLEKALSNGGENASDHVALSKSTRFDKRKVR